jgi:sucrose-6-phosphate hydrolase SacC (GH32 family)
LVGDGFVLQEGGSYHMWYIFGTGWRSYEGSSVPERTYKIGHAESVDGIDWSKTSEGTAIIPDALGEAESQALPCVIKIAGIYHMFFCYRHSWDFRTNPKRGYRIGHAFSKDLMNWVRDDQEIPLEHNDGSWDSDMMCYPGVCESRGQTYLLYNGNEFGRHGFGAAVLER